MPETFHYFDYCTSFLLIPKISGSASDPGPRSQVTGHVSLWLFLCVWLPFFVFGRLFVFGHLKTTFLFSGMLFSMWVPVTCIYCVTAGSATSKIKMLLAEGWSTGVSKLAHHRSEHLMMRMCSPSAAAHLQWYDATPKMCHSSIITAMCFDAIKLDLMLAWY